MATRMTPQQKAAKINELRESGQSDADIIATEKNLQAGYAWLKDNPGQAADTAPAKKQPIGSGAMAHHPQAFGSYGAATRAPQLG